MAESVVLSNVQPMEFQKASLLAYKQAHSTQTLTFPKAQPQALQVITKPDSCLSQSAALLKAPHKVDQTNHLIDYLSLLQPEV